MRTDGLDWQMMVADDELTVVTLGEASNLQETLCYADKVLRACMVFTKSVTVVCLPVSVTL